MLRNGRSVINEKIRTSWIISIIIYCCLLYTSDPKLTGGWRNSFSWNGLELNMLFNFSLGGKVFDTMRTSITDTDGYGIFYNSSIDQLDTVSYTHLDVYKRQLPIS